MDFKYVGQLRAWTQKVLPVVYDDSLSYMELLAKITQKLNILIANNNIIPETIRQIVLEYLQGPDFEGILTEVIADFILNVKYPPNGLTPAVGDGTKDDTAAIQGCLDYATSKGGMCVYFPSGKYLTKTLTIPSNVSITGFDRYTTKLVMAAGATSPMINGTAGVADIGIYNITLDANAGVQVNDVTLLELKCNNALISNVIFTDAYQSVNYVGTGGHLQMDNIIFDSAVTKHMAITGDVVAEVTNAVVNSLSLVAGECLLEIDASGGYYEFTSKATTPVGVIINGDDNSVVCGMENATSNVQDNGLRNNYIVRGVEQHKYLTGAYNIVVGGSYGLQINGAKSENIGMNDAKIVAGDASLGVNGTYTENYGGQHTVTGVGEKETFTQQKTTEADMIFLNPTKPLKYGEVKELNDFFKFIDMQDKSGNAYKVLVQTDLTYALSTGDLIDVKYPGHNLTGIAGDGVTDDAAAFEAIVAYAKANDVGILVPSGVTMLLGSDVNAAEVYYFVSRGKITGDGVLNLGGYATNPSKTEVPPLVIDVLSANKLKLTGIKNGSVRIMNAASLLLYADGLYPATASLAYSSFILGNIANFTVQAINNGWVNENVFIGGRFSTFLFDGDYECNSNTFYKPFLEGCTLTFNVGRYNQMYDCRLEGACTITFADNTHDNIIERSWYSSGPYGIGPISTAANITLVDTGYNNVIANKLSLLSSDAVIFEVNASNKAFNSDYMYIDDDGLIHPTRAFETLGETEPIELSKMPMVIMGDTDVTNFRITATFYDADMNQIEADSNPGFAYSGVAWSAVNNNYASTVNQGNFSTYFSAYSYTGSTETPKYVKFKFTLGSLTTPFRDFKVVCRHANNAPTGCNAITPVRTHGTKVPTQGNWVLGDIIWNDNPTETVAWVCTASGAPGTWMAFNASPLG